MNLSNEINEIIQNTKGLAIDLSKDSKMETLKEDLTGAVEKTVDHATKYVIKALPVPDAVKDVLMDIKDAIKTKDIKEVIYITKVNNGIANKGLSSKMFMCCFIISKNCLAV